MEPGFPTSPPARQWSPTLQMGLTVVSNSGPLYCEAIDPKTNHAPPPKPPSGILRAQDLPAWSLEAGEGQALSV